MKKEYKKSIKRIKRNSKSGAKLKKNIINKIINKKMSFAEVLEKYPRSAEIFMKSGMHCFGCSMAAYESLEQGALMHGLNPDKLVDELNKKFAGSKAK